MRALVTGAGGFVGPHLCRHLQEEGDEVAALSLDGCAVAAGIQFFSTDIRDRAAVQQVVKAVQPESVYHLAGITTLAAAAADPSLTLAVNVGGTANIFAAVLSLQQPARVLNLSSSHVYSEAVEEVSETSSISPANAYAASKAMAEWVPVVMGAGDWITVRPFNHSGPGQSTDFVLSSFASQIAEMELRKRPPVLHVGDLQVERDFLDVRDVVRAYRLLMIRGRGRETYNVASGRSSSLASILDLFQAASSTRFEVEVVEDRRRGQQRHRIRCSPAKVHEDTGWSPRIPLRTTIEDLLEYWRARYSETRPAGQPR